MVKSWTPAPTSEPDHRTGKTRDTWDAGSGDTLLVGLVSSMVFDQTEVGIDGFESKTMVAPLVTTFPVANGLVPLTFRETDPPVPGGGIQRLDQSAAGRYFGSIDCKVQVKMSVIEFSDAVTLTSKLTVGLKSTCVENVPRANSGSAAGFTTWPENVMGPRDAVERSNLVGSTKSVILTCCAGAVAEASFPNEIK